MCFSYTFNVDRFLWRLKSKLEMSIVISSRSRVTKKNDHWVCNSNCFFNTFSFFVSLLLLHRYSSCTVVIGPAVQLGDDDGVDDDDDDANDVRGLVFLLQVTWEHLSQGTMHLTIESGT